MSTTTLRRIVFSSASFEWRTPAKVYDDLHAEFGFTLDPCPIDGRTDGLSPMWCKWQGERVFCNPPYGPAVGKWIARAKEADVAVYLLPARTDTRWFHDLVLPHTDDIRFIRGRLRFGNSEHNAPFPSMIVVFGD